MARGTLSSRPSLNISKGDDYHHTSSLVSHQQQQWSDSEDEGGSDGGDAVEAEDCPLCLEEMDESDVRFIPCPCGYQVQPRMLWGVLIDLTVVA